MEPHIHTIRRFQRQTYRLLERIARFIHRLDLIKALDEAGDYEGCFVEGVLFCFSGQQAESVGLGSRIGDEVVVEIRREVLQASAT